MDDKRKITALMVSLMQVIDPPLFEKFKEYSKTGDATKAQKEQFADFRNRAFAQAEILASMHYRLAATPTALIVPSEQGVIRAQ